MPATPGDRQIGTAGSTRSRRSTASYSGSTSVSSKSSENGRTATSSRRSVPVNPGCSSSSLSLAAASSSSGALLEAPCVSSRRSLSASAADSKACRKKRKSEARPDSPTISLRIKKAASAASPAALALVSLTKKEQKKKTNEISSAATDDNSTATDCSKSAFESNPSDGSSPPSADASLGNHDSAIAFQSAPQSSEASLTSTSVAQQEQQNNSGEEERESQNQPNEVLAGPRDGTQSGSTRSQNVEDSNFMSFLVNFKKIVSKDSEIRLPGTAMTPYRFSCRGFFKNAKKLEAVVTINSFSATMRASPRVVSLETTESRSEPQPADSGFPDAVAAIGFYPWDSPAARKTYPTFIYKSAARNSKILKPVPMTLELPFSLFRLISRPPPQAELVDIMRIHSVNLFWALCMAGYFIIAVEDAQINSAVERHATANNSSRSLAAASTTASSSAARAENVALSSDIMLIMRCFEVSSSRISSPSAIEHSESRTGASMSNSAVTGVALCGAGAPGGSDDGNDRNPPRDNGYTDNNNNNNNNNNNSNNKDSDSDSSSDSSSGSDRNSNNNSHNSSLSANWGSSRNSGSEATDNNQSEATSDDSSIPSSDSSDDSDSDSDSDDSDQADENVVNNHYGLEQNNIEQEVYPAIQNEAANTTNAPANPETASSAVQQTAPPVANGICYPVAVTFFENPNQGIYEVSDDDSTDENDYGNFGEEDLNAPDLSDDDLPPGSDDDFFDDSDDDFFADEDDENNEVAPEGDENNEVAPEGDENNEVAEEDDQNNEVAQEGDYENNAGENLQENSSQDLPENNDFANSYQQQVANANSSQYQVYNPRGEGFGLVRVPTTEEQSSDDGYDPNVNVNPINNFDPQADAYADAYAYAYANAVAHADADAHAGVGAVDAAFAPIGQNGIHENEAPLDGANGGASQHHHLALLHGLRNEDEMAIEQLVENHVIGFAAEANLEIPAELINNEDVILGANEIVAPENHNQVFANFDDVQPVENHQGMLNIFPLSDDEFSDDNEAQDVLYHHNNPPQMPEQEFDLGQVVDDLGDPDQNADDGNNGAPHHHHQENLPAAVPNEAHADAGQEHEEGGEYQQAQGNAGNQEGFLNVQQHDMLPLQVQNIHDPLNFENGNVYPAALHRNERAGFAHNSIRSMASFAYNPNGVPGTVGGLAQADAGAAIYPVSAFELLQQEYDLLLLDEHRQRVARQMQANLQQAQVEADDNNDENEEEPENQEENEI